MFNHFLAALVQKISQFLIKHDDFLTKGKKEREEILKNISIPTAFKQYLTEVTTEQIITDFNLVIAYTQKPKTAIKDNNFFIALKHFLLTDLARKIDHLDNEYYLMPISERQIFVEKLINGQSPLAKSLQQILVNKTYQQLVNAIYKLSDDAQETPFVVIQTPREIPQLQKKKIRDHLQESHPANLPIFQINHKLIGGIRIFVDGVTSDQSWLSRVHKFTSLTAV